MRSILAWTVENFDTKQAQRYRKTILAALRDLGEGPDVIGVRKRDDLRPNIRTLHVARQGRHGRHVIIFTAYDDSHQIRIARILHDSMDPTRHLPEE